jgi:hypothetical protein
VRRQHWRANERRARQARGRQAEAPRANERRGAVASALCSFARLVRRPDTDQGGRLPSFTRHGRERCFGTPSKPSMSCFLETRRRGPSRAAGRGLCWAGRADHLRVGLISFAYRAVPEAMSEPATWNPLSQPQSGLYPLQGQTEIHTSQPGRHIQESQRLTGPNVALTEHSLHPSKRMLQMAGWA